MAVSGPVIYAIYLGVFTLAAVGCFASLVRLSQISDVDTRRGLQALLLTSGGWALTIVGFLLAPTRPLKLSFYVLGLVLGLATVGAWLYFTSAYTNRTYHRNKTFRRLAVVVYLLLIAIKITNPMHGEYFTTTALSTPFPHLSLSMGPLHWVAMGLSYALAFVGYFMLLELFREIDLDTRPLVVLVGITALPVLFDIVGFTLPMFIDITYEPLGVAVFSVGIAFVYLDRFDAVQLAAEEEQPIIALDSDRDIRETNRAARRLFPELEANRTGPLEELLPAVSNRLESAIPVLEIERGEFSQYHHLTETPYSAGRSGLGSTITLTDVTERERYRQELERQNERLDRFASLLSHDLRNPLTVAQGRFDLINAELPPENEHASTVQNALDRMGSMIEDILAMARQGQPVETGAPVQLASIAEQCWEMVETTDGSLTVKNDWTILADEKRLVLLFENLMRNAIDHGGSETALRIGPLPDQDGFFVEDDGPGIPEADREQVFEAGYSTDEDGTGFGLSIVADIVAAHGWDIQVTDSATGGARFEITGVEFVE